MGVSMDGTTAYFGLQTHRRLVSEDDDCSIRTHRSRVDLAAMAFSRVRCHWFIDWFHFGHGTDDDDTVFLFSLAKPFISKITP